MHPLPVLLTRPKDDAMRLAARLRAGGAGPVVVSPLLRIALVAMPSLPIGAGVLLTSASAVLSLDAAGVAGKGRPAWVVGPRTAARARAAGFEVRGVAADADELARIVPRDAVPLVHLRGAVARGDLVAALRARGIAASEAVVYAQEAVPLSREALALIAAGPVLAPLYSPRTAALLMAACPPAWLGNLRPVCLSPAVARACTVPPAAIAARPDGPAMEAAILANSGPSQVEGAEASG